MVTNLDMLNRTRHIPGEARMDFTPTIIEKVAFPGGHVELVEWLWPDVIDFRRSEADLMLEMSLPPYATDSSAELPDLAPGSRCFIGTLFVRFPGVVIHGRGEGGRIRVLRMIFSAGPALAAVEERPLPDPGQLKGLLDIRSEPLRRMMSLALREINRSEDRSVEALAALHALVGIELRRLFDRQLAPVTGGRLAAWQYRRIRERLAAGGPPPKAAELARLCGISVRHLGRQFHALTGTTLAVYVEHFRIEQARTMLADLDMPIKNVAFASGFTHPNSFARAFRRATGLSPQEFRQRARLVPAPDPTSAPD